MKLENYPEAENLSDEAEGRTGRSIEPDESNRRYGRYYSPKRQAERKASFERKRRSFEAKRQSSSGKTVLVQKLVKRSNVVQNERFGVKV